MRNHGKISISLLVFSLAAFGFAHPGAQEKKAKEIRLLFSSSTHGYFDTCG